MRGASVVRNLFLQNLLLCLVFSFIRGGDLWAEPQRSPKSPLPSSLQVERKQDGSEWTLEEQEAQAVHAISVRGTPKYPQDFNCFKSYYASAPKKGHVRIPVMGTVFDTLNPFLPTGICAQGMGLYSALPFDTLMERAPEEPFTFYPRLAHKVFLSPDRSFVTFFLNPEARFHDGTPVHADDVVFTYEAIRDNGSPARKMLGKRIKSVKALNSHVVRFDFFPFEDGQIDQELPFIIAGMVVLSQNSLQGKEFAKTGLTPLMGSGPYRVKEVHPGQSITYERDPSYWGKDQPSLRGLYNFEKITFEYFGNDTVGFEAFKTGLVDHWSESNPARWNNEYNFSAVKEGHVLKETMTFRNAAHVTVLVFNIHKRILENPLTRKALSFLIDVQWMNQNLFEGSLTPTSSFFGGTLFEAKGAPSPAEKAILQNLPDVPSEVLEGPLPEAPATDGSGNVRPQIAKAHGFLREAGWSFKDGKWVDKNGRILELELLVNDQKNEKLALAYGRVLEKAGIRLHIRLVDSAQYQKRLADRKFDLIFHGFGTGLSPGTEQKLYWLSAFARVPSRNYAGIESKAIDAICDRVVSSKTQEELTLVMKILDRLLRHGFYMRPLFARTTDRVAYWSHLHHPPLDGWGLPSLYSWWWAEPKTVVSRN